MAVLAAILMVVSYNMGEWREIPELLKLTKTDISVWLVTFALTVFADLTVAVEAGMILAALLFISRVADYDHGLASDRRLRRGWPRAYPAGQGHPLLRDHLPHPWAVPVWRDGQDRRGDAKLHELPPVVILRLRNMTALDATGLFALEELARTLKKSGRELILCGAREQPLRLIQQTEFEDLVGPANICGNVQEALARAEEAFERLQPAHAVTTT